MELTKNGINDTNIKKLYRKFQILNSPKPLILQAKATKIFQKTALQSFAATGDFFLGKIKFSIGNRLLPRKQGTAGYHSFKELPRTIKSAFRTLISGMYSVSPDKIR